MLLTPVWAGQKQKFIFTRPMEELESLNFQNVKLRPMATCVCWGLMQNRYSKCTRFTFYIDCNDEIFSQRFIWPMLGPSSPSQNTASCIDSRDSITVSGKSAPPLSEGGQFWNWSILWNGVLSVKLKAYPKSDVCPKNIFPFPSDHYGRVLAMWSDHRNPGI